MTLRLISLFLFLYGFPCYPQLNKDTLKYTNRFLGRPHFGQVNWMKDGNGLYLKNKYIPYDQAYNLLPTLVSTDFRFSKSVADGKMVIPHRLSVEDCIFYADAATYDDYLQSLPLSVANFSYTKGNAPVYLANGFSIENCESDMNIGFNNLRSPSGSDITLLNNKIKWVYFDSVECGRIILFENLLKYVAVNHSKLNSLLFFRDSTSFDSSYGFGKKYDSLKYTNEPGDKAEHIKEMLIEVDNLIADTISFYNLQGPAINMAFRKLKMNGQFLYVENITGLDSLSFETEEDNYMAENSINRDFSRSYPKKINQTLYAGFKDCYINGPVITNTYERASTFQFTNCEFGPNADLHNLYFDTLIIDNCIKIANTLYLQIPDTGNCYISLANSNIRNIDFEYKRNVHLYYNCQTDSKDKIANLFSGLLEKFKGEGRVASYENLDIEYKQWQYGTRGLWGKVKNFINRHWWYYGYRKGYIIYWTLGLLCFFVILNFILWKKFGEIYQLFGAESYNHYDAAGFFKHRVPVLSLPSSAFSGTLRCGGAAGVGARLAGAGADRREPTAGCNEFGLGSRASAGAAGGSGCSRSQAATRGACAAPKRRRRRPASGSASPPSTALGNGAGVSPRPGESDRDSRGVQVRRRSGAGALGVRSGSRANGQAAGGGVELHRGAAPQRPRDRFDLNAERQTREHERRLAARMLLLSAHADAFSDSGQGLRRRHLPRQRQLLRHPTPFGF